MREDVKGSLMKKMIDLLILITILLLVVRGPLYAASESSHLNAGTMGASFLKIVPDARSFALNGADVANPSKIGAIYVNPANVQLITDNVIQLSYIKWLFNMIGSEISYGFFVPTFGPVMISYFNLTSDDIGYTVDSHIPTDYFKTISRVLSVSSSLALNKYMIFGLTGKILNQQLYDNYASGLAVDFGGIYITNRAAIQNEVLQKIVPGRFGFGLRNFGFVAPVIKKVALTPVTFFLGTEYYLWDVLRLDFSLNKEFDYFTKFNIGCEYNYLDILYLRFSMSLHNRAADLGVLSHINGGIGIDLGNYSFDYSFKNMGYFGFVHQLSFNIDFGRTYKGPQSFSDLTSIFKRRKSQPKEEEVSETEVLKEEVKAETEVRKEIISAATSDTSIISDTFVEGLDTGIETSVSEITKETFVTESDSAALAEKGETSPLVIEEVETRVLSDTALEFDTESGVPSSEVIIETTAEVTDTEVMNIIKSAEAIMESSGETVASDTSVVHEQALVDTAVPEDIANIIEESSKASEIIVDLGTTNETSPGNTMTTDTEILKIIEGETTEGESK